MLREWSCSTGSKPVMLVCGWFSDLRRKWIGISCMVWCGAWYVIPLDLTLWLG